MPELPEVETVRAYLERVRGHRIREVTLRRADLRYPIDVPAVEALEGAEIRAVRRRGKYLLIDVCTTDRSAVESDPRTLLIHLGMSGQLVLDPVADAPYGKHEHARFTLQAAASTVAMRFFDPRRFGAIDVMSSAGADSHKLLRNLGPEPFSGAFDGAYLYAKSRKRKLATKQLIMDGRIVVGVGNIYASEACWRAKVSPFRAAGRLSRRTCDALAVAIVDVLAEAVQMGGTTLKDFVGGDGAPGYFKQRLDAYDRAGQPCRRCADSVICKSVQQGRMTYWCQRCQR
jgi:formamidopyrimidine-DNA glycosylase